MSIVTRAPAAIRAISPYVPGKPISELAREIGLDEAKIVKLASNENPLGMSPLAQKALFNSLADIPRYPDGNAFALKTALAQKYQLTPANILLGNGSNDVLELIAAPLLLEGGSAIYAQHAFAVYPLATQAHGGRGIEVPAKDYGHDLDAMLAAIEPDTRLIFIANPNNPTGTFIPGPALQAFIARVPADVLVVLDEAYTEYLAPQDQYNAIDWLAAFPNLLISRTFSKAYGLAGLRVGYALAQPDVIDLLNRVRQPFNVSVPAQAAAIAALADTDFLFQSAQLNAQGMQQLTQAFQNLNLPWIPSHGNFVTVQVSNSPQETARINQSLLTQGVIVRPIGGYGLPTWLRVSIGLESENARFITALQHALKN